MVTLKVNGHERTVTAPEDTPLLWTLREELGLTGTKFGCGMGLCGACTVLVGGEAIRSCVTPLSAVKGKPITTIEGLASSTGPLTPVQTAWLELDVVQCGYCQPGQILAATALLRQTPQPSDADIDQALAGNLCRCGTYPRIRAAVHRAADLLAKAAK